MLQIGSYSLDERIARGGTAGVWAGRHLESGLPVAIKVVDSDAAAQAILHREVRAIAGLTHRHIVNVIDYGTVTAPEERACRGAVDVGCPYLVMERAEGTLRDRQPKSYVSLRATLLSVLDALAHAHARGIIHRDLKSSNVLLVQGLAKVADFGIAHRIGQDREGEGVVRGTPAFMAPEQFEARRQDYGPATDLYALGCMAYTLACGDPPYGTSSSFAAMAAAHQHDPTPPLFPRMAVPDGLEAWLGGLLQKDPMSRYQLAADAAQALLALGEPARDDGSEASAPLSTPTVQLTSLGPIDLELSPRLPSSDATAEDVAPPTLRERRFPDHWQEDVPERQALPGLLGLGLYWLRSHPTVGRVQERQAMWDSLREVVTQGATRVVVLEGGAGVGKSEMARWLGQRAQELGLAQTMVAVHDAPGGASHGLTAMLRRYFRTEDLAPDAIAAQIDRLAAGRGLLEDDERDTLARLLDTTSGWMPLRVGERHALFSRVLQSAARARPLVVRLDDVHWEPDTIAFLHHHLARASGSATGILFVLTARPDLLARRPAESKLLAELVRASHTRRLTLSPFADDELIAVMEQVLPLERRSARRVADWSRGNPLFALQLLGDAVDEGRLSVREGTFVMSFSERDRPADVAAIGNRRLELALSGLSRSDEALELAAVLGRSIDGAEWSAVCDEGGVPRPEGLVERLIDRNLAVAPPDQDPQRGWSFAHGFVREILLRRAHRAGRLASHHRLCARAIRARGGPFAGDRIARHLAEAGEPRSAEDPLLEVGAATRLQTSDFVLADALLQERELALEKAGCPRSDARWGEGWLLRAGLSARRGNALDAQRWAEATLEEAHHHGWREVELGARLILASLHRRSGDTKRASDQVRLAEGCAGEERELRGRCRVEEAQLCEALGELSRAKRLWEGAREDLTDDKTVAEITCAMGRIAAQEGDRQGAMALIREARKRFRDMGARYGVGRCFMLMGDVARWSGAPDAAAGYYERALKRLVAVGAVDAVAGCRLRMALLRLDAGATAEVAEALGQSRAELEALGRGSDLPTVLAASLVAAVERGERDEAATHARKLVASLSGGLASADVARLGERAARGLRAAGQDDLASRMQSLAASQYRALGRAADATRLDGAG